MNKFYVREDDDMDQQRIESDFDDAANFGRGVASVIGLTFLLIVLLWCATAGAQTITAPTRESAADWTCEDANGAVLSPHQRFDTAFVACYNNAAGVFVQGGRYRINRATVPPVEPPVPPTPSAPTNLTGTAVPNPTNPTNSNITLTWDAVAGVTEYELWRCSGPNCTGFVFFKDVADTTYTATNQPPGITYKYRVRVWKPTTGPYSSIYTITTPTNTPPPPQASGKATVSWDMGAWNVEQSPLGGFTVLYGTSPASLTQSVVVRGAALRSCVVENLSVGTWYFTVTSQSESCWTLPSMCYESGWANVASKVVQ